MTNPMIFAVTPERAALRDSVERYAAQRYPAEAQLARLAAADAWNRERWRDIVEMGWLATDFDEVRGGLGLGFSLLGTIVEALAPGLAPEPLLTQAGVAGYLLNATSGANAALFDAWLAGERIVALAHHELTHAPYYASPIASEFRRTGAGIVLDASKTTVLDGAIADTLLVSARDAEPPHAPALVCVPVSCAQLRLEPRRAFDGRTIADIDIRAARLPPDALLNAGSDLAVLIDEALSRYTVLNAAEGLGIMRAMIDLTGGYLREREQFGQKIGNFQALQHRLVDMQLCLTRTESLVEAAYALVDAAGLAAATPAIAAARISAEDSGVFIAEQAIQLHGGIGMTDEYILAHYVKRITANRFMAGDRAEHVLRLNDPRVQAR